ncbi:MAG: DUF3570 domain-containing protein [Kofleriaceae bacterium]
MRGAWLAPAALVAALASAPPAIADGDLTLRTVYYKERATRVEQPMVDGRFDVGDHGSVDGHLLVDAITSASVAAGADGAGFSERRVEGGLGYAHTFGRLTAGITGRYSSEPDYTSSFVTARLQAELAQKNFTLAVVGGVGTDEVTNAGAPPLVPRIRGALDAYLVSASVTQLLGATTLASVTYDLSYLDGFQQNPYRMVVAGGTVVGERHPTTRLRQAIAARVRRYLPATSTTVIAGYRLYRDDWGVVAHTPELRVVQEAGDTMDVALGYRLHHQRGADFWSESYASADPMTQPYLTADGKLATMTTQALAVTFGVTGATFGWDDRWAAVRGELRVEYYLQDNRYFGNAGIAHAALTIPFEY